jgi:hypothetical protein
VDANAIDHSVDTADERRDLEPYVLVRDQLIACR